MSDELDQRRTTLVRDAYSAAARDPGGEHPFAVGRELALGVGYPRQLLDRLPEPAVASFAGVAAVSLTASLRPGDCVLDLGCGAGLDSLVAAERVRPGGNVLGIDFSADMLARAASTGAENVAWCQASAEALPLADGSVDAALVNGIFNLNPERSRIFAELARVVRPGGRVHAAELVLRGPLPEPERTDANWFAWITGAQEAVAFQAEFTEAGFRQVELVRAVRNGRTKNPHVLAAEVCAIR